MFLHNYYYQIEKENFEHVWEAISTILAFLAVISLLLAPIYLYRITVKYLEDKRARFNRRMAEEKENDLEARPNEPLVETPQEETPQVETPQVETPQVETPQIETPQVKTPQVETPKEPMPVMIIDEPLEEGPNED